MRTKGYERNTNAGRLFAQSNDDRMKNAGIFNETNCKLVNSCPDNLADEIICGLITLKQANLLTDENCKSMMSFPEQAWPVALLIACFKKLDFNPPINSELLKQF